MKFIIMFFCSLLRIDFTFRLIPLIVTTVERHQELPLNGYARALF